MRKILAFLVVALTVAIWTGTAAACNTSARGNNTTHYFDGFATFGGNLSIYEPNGIDSQIYTTNPYIYTGCCGGSFSSAWDGLVDPAINLVGQMGWENNINGGDAWSGVAQGNSWVKSGMPNTWTKPGVGSIHDYKVTYSAGAFHIFYDGVNKYNYTGFSEPDTYTWRAEVEGEINTIANQMAGTQSNLQSFDQLKIRFHNLGGSGNNGWDSGQDGWSGSSDNPTYYKYSGPYLDNLGYYYVNIWDTCTT